MTEPHSQAVVAVQTTRSPVDRFRLVRRFAGLSITVLLIGYGAANVATAVTFSSRYSDATIFRDRNRNGALDLKEQRTLTNALGRFVPPKGKGQLYLQGGFDIDSGQPNYLLLSAPTGTRGIGVLTTLFRALSRTESPQTVRALLGLNPDTKLADIAFLPVPEESRFSLAQRRDAQQELLARFLKRLTLGAVNPTSALAAASATAAAPNASSEPPGDATIEALAAALRSAAPPAQTPTDLTNVATVTSVFRSALTNLNSSSIVTNASLINVVSRSASDLNVALQTASPIDSTFTRVRQIASNASRVVAANDVGTLTTAFTAQGLQDQIGGALQNVGNPTTTTELISLAADGGSANARSVFAEISADGRYVVFTSLATNLVASPERDAEQVYFRDTATRTTERVARAFDGGTPNGGSGTPALNDDGRFIVFASNATNLLDGEDNGPGAAFSNIYLFDRRFGTTRAVSVARDGNLGQATSEAPRINASGKFVTFLSRAPNLVGAELNGVRNVFRRDLTTGQTRLVSRGLNNRPITADVDAQDMSGSGRYVVFSSAAENVVPNDGNENSDVFLRDMADDKIVLVSRNPNGVPAGGASSNPRISADGRFVVFVSTANDLVQGSINLAGRPQIYRFDRLSGSNELVTTSTSLVGATGISQSPSISRNGRMVAFESNASDLATLPQGTFNNGIFVRDMDLPFAALVSVGLGSGFGNLPSGTSTAPRISKDGRSVAFLSNAANLVVGNTNRTGDVYAAISAKDFGVTPRTAGRLVGSTVNSSIDIARDRDWFGVNLSTGQFYQIDLEGAGTGQGNLVDPVIEGIFDSRGNFVPGTFDDNSGGNLNAHLDFEPRQSGLHFISVAAQGAAIGTYRLRIIGQPQTIAFSGLPSQTLATPTFTLGATASSGLPVLYRSDTPTVCSIDGITVSLLAIGRCSITAQQPGDAKFAAAADIVQAFFVKRPQSINFGSIAGQTLTRVAFNGSFRGDSFNVFPVAGSGLPVRLASTNRSVCTVSGNTISLVHISFPIFPLAPAAATCRIQAFQDGNDEWLAAPRVDRSFRVTYVHTLF